MKHPGWKLLVKLLMQNTNAKQLEQILELLLTDDERHDLSARCQIISGLLQGKCSQRQLARELEVSIAKITRGSNAIKTLSPSIIELLQELLP
jgi:TrpR family trp operon transcriptional repressor